MIRSAAMTPRNRRSLLMLCGILTVTALPVPLHYDWLGSDKPRGKPDRSTPGCTGPTEITRQKK